VINIHTIMVNSCRLNRCIGAQSRDIAIVNGCGSIRFIGAQSMISIFSILEWEEY
jgi:hypothetical protein